MQFCLKVLNLLSSTLKQTQMNFVNSKTPKNKHRVASFTDFQTRRTLRTHHNIVLKLERFKRAALCLLTFWYPMNLENLFSKRPSSINAILSLWFFFTSRKKSFRAARFLLLGLFFSSIFFCENLTPSKPESFNETLGKTTTCCTDEFETHKLMIHLTTWHFRCRWV